MTNNARVNSYFFQANNDFEKSQNLLGSNFDMSTTPFYSVKHHGASVLYPVAHAAHAIKNLLKIAEGGLLLIHALFSEPKTSIPKVLNGMTMELGALVLNCLNTAASLITFATRTLSTIFNFGYTSSNLKSAFDGLKGKEVGGRNEETVMNMFKGMGLGMADQVLQNADDSIMDQTLSL